MSIVHIASAVLAESDAHVLPVSSVVYPLIAVGFFALLGAVAWSYRDVANRHANKTRGAAPHDSGH